MRRRLIGRRGEREESIVIFSHKLSTGPVLRITRYGAITLRGQQSNYESWEELTVRSPWAEIIAAKEMGKGVLVCKCVLVCEHDGESQRRNTINLPSLHQMPPLSFPTTSFMMSAHMM